MNIQLFDHPDIRQSLLPLTFTRPVADLRVGIITNAEKWAHDLGTSTSYLTVDYLRSKFPASIADDNLYINGAVFPDSELVKAVLNIKSGQGLEQDGVVLAHRGGNTDSLEEISQNLISCKAYPHRISILKNTWDIFLFNGEQIEADYRRLTSHRITSPLTDPHTVVYNEGNLFIEEGANIKAAIINAESGPVYIGKNTEVQEGTIIQGPFALCEEAQLRLGGKMRPNTTVGPGCKVGGEVGNVIFQEYSNKAHEGFLGNSVVGAWCNLGADTNNSNLKNNYATVRVWDYRYQKSVDSGLQFCGMVMGDYSKCGINTMFNTGTVIGVNANLFGPGFPPKFVPSFTWGGSGNLMEYDFDKACETATRVMHRKSMVFEEYDRNILKHIYHQTAVHRQTVLN